LARDKASDEFEEVSLSLAWQENLQVMGIVASHNDNEPSASAAAAQSTSPQAARVSAEDRAVEPVQVGTEGQTAEPDWVQNPAIIRIDPTSGSRTILSDVDIPTEEDLSREETEDDEALTTPGPTWLIPQGIAVEPDGQIAVTDAGRGALIRVDPVTGRRHAFSGSGPSLIRPNGVAAYPQESGLNRTLAIADSGRSVVFELNGSRTMISDKKFEDEPEQVNLEAPFGLAVENNCTEDDCRVVVADAGLRAIVRLDRRTEERSTISGPETGSGPKLRVPVDIDVASNGQLFVVDVGHNAIVRVDPTNGSRAIVSGAGTGDGPMFQRVRALAIESDGRLAVLDEGARTVFRVDPSNGERSIISGPETGSGPELRVPVDIAVASDGRLIVVDSAPLSTAFENPSGDFVGGIGLVSGWAFANVPTATLSSVVFTIDDNEPIDVPCCSSRGDVQASFPERPWASESGFGLVTNFNLLRSGSHTFELTVEDTSGNSHTQSRSVETVKLGDSEFLDRFDMANAEVDLSDGRLSVEQVQVRDEASQASREINASFIWQESCQCFVVQGECGNGSVESNEECDGENFDGQTCESLGFDDGNLSCRASCTLDFSECTGGLPVLVTNSGDDTVSVVSAATYEEEVRIPVGENPRGIAISPPPQAVAYVTNAGSDSVSVIELDTNTVIDTIDVGNTPVGVAFTPDGRRAYVVNAGQDRVSVINTTSRAVETDIRVGREPQEIAINTAGTRAYVTNFGDRTISVIDLVRHTLLTTVDVGKGPNGIAVRPHAAEVYVVNLEDSSVSIIDTNTNQVVGTLTREEDEGRIGLLPQKVAFSPDGQKAFITNSLDSTVSIIDTATRTNLDTSVVGRYRYRSVYDEPNGIFIPPNGLRFYVSLFGRSGQGGYLGVYIVTNHRLEAFVEVGEGPIGMAGGPG
jgi:YVTN family beta-propeller protein